jgi:hypothetical protein
MRFSADGCLAVDYHVRLQAHAITKFDLITYN